MCIKYPNQNRYYVKSDNLTSLNKPKNYKKSHLGISFEEAINDSNKYYLKNDLAVIYKKPTPIQVVKVSYPKRSQAKIIEAYYKIPSTTDYNGIYKGRYIDFEAKSTNYDSFSFGRIYEHQIEHLVKVKQLGAIAFLIIEFVKHEEVYILEIDKLYERYLNSKNGGRKSIPYEDFKKYGFLVKQRSNPKLDYLEIVDLLIKNCD